jgi:hypothetical protein
VRVPVGIDELDVQADLVARQQQGPLEDRVHAQLVADHRHRLVRPLVLHDRRARDDVDAGDLRELRQELVVEPGGQERRVCLSRDAHVGEGQDRDGRPFTLGHRRPWDLQRLSFIHPVRGRDHDDQHAGHSYDQGRSKESSGMQRRTLWPFGRKRPPARTRAPRIGLLGPHDQSRLRCRELAADVVGTRDRQPLVRDREDGGGVLHPFEMRDTQGHGRDRWVVLDLVVDLAGHGDAARGGEGLDPRRDVDAVTVDALLVVDDITGVDADPDGNEVLLRQFELDLDGRLNRFDGAREDAEAAVSIVLENPPVVVRHRARQDVAMPIPLGAGRRLVLLHEARVPHEVGEHDRRELAGRFLRHGASPSRAPHAGPCSTA